MRKSTLSTALALAAVLGLAGCSEETRGASGSGDDTCDEDWDCSGGRVCNKVTHRCEQPGSVGEGEGEGPAEGEGEGAAEGEGEGERDAGHPVVDPDSAAAKEQPYVVETVPAHGTRGVPVGADFRLTHKFSEPVNKTKVEAGIFLPEVGKGMAQGNVSLLVEYDEATMTVRATPVDAQGSYRKLAPYGIYNLWATTEITDFDEPRRYMRENAAQFSVAGDAQVERDYKALALEFAPVIYQDVAGGTALKADFLTSLNFDEDWDVTNNYEQHGRKDLVASVYYSVVESESHWFITYGYYHTHDRGYANDVVRENSMKGAVVVVAKANRMLRLVETYSHQGQVIESFTPQGSGYTHTDAAGASGLVSMAADWLTEGRRYNAYLTEGRHDSCVWPQERGDEIGPFCRHNARSFKEGALSGVKYVPAAEGIRPDFRHDEDCQAACDAGERCRGGQCHNTPYGLVDLVSQLWVRRVEFAGETLWAADTEFVYQPPDNRPGTGLRLPGRFIGDSGDQHNEGEPPWSWRDPEARSLPKGAWLLDPAWALHQRYNVPEAETWSERYCWNPFFGIDERTEGPCAQ